MNTSIFLLKLVLGIFACIPSGLNPEVFENMMLQHNQQATKYSEPAPAINLLLFVKADSSNRYLYLVGKTTVFTTDHISSADIPVASNTGLCRPVDKKYGKFAREVHNTGYFDRKSKKGIA